MTDPIEVAPASGSTAPPQGDGERGRAGGGRPRRGRVPRQSNKAASLDAGATTDGATTAMGHSVEPVASRRRQNPKATSKRATGADADADADADAGSPERLAEKVEATHPREVGVEDLLQVAESVPGDQRASTSGPDDPVVLQIPRRAEIRAARRLQARKVGRLVRHIDLWSLLKVVLLFYLCLLVVAVVAGMVVWSVLQRSGAISSVEGFIEQVFLLEEFRFEGGDLLRIGVVGGLVAVLVGSLLTVLGGLLFNLISDLTGGVRMSVVELESARPVARRARR